MSPDTFPLRAAAKPAPGDPALALCDHPVLGRPASLTTAVDPVSVLLRRLATGAPDPRVRRWASALLERGEPADSPK
jgi:hypothetical protein